VDRSREEILPRAVVKAHGESLGVPFGSFSAVRVMVFGLADTGLAAYQANPTR
jgi:hypothetical protein